jgi:hypothetical protein
VHAFSDLLAAFATHLSSAQEAAAEGFLFGRRFNSSRSFLFLTLPHTNAKPHLRIACYVQHALELFFKQKIFSDENLAPFSAPASHIVG